ncbi:Nucleoporin autopeptidase [Rhynchospora pubera]|uniref:Nucleoporin autopeptidase n=1 Tax=Rhynchospora pubera TaxID=906938 RepID=A0AAV8DHN5_9POAL|nr:Nucleoporin autopeptidase [Rhynchospora pubera]
MFGSTNPFGQSSSSPFGQSSTTPFGQPSTNLFGSPSPFGHTPTQPQPPNQNNNPFAPKPFGSPTTSPFGAQSGSSLFGGTSTGVFAQSSTPLFGSSSTPPFGASSSPAFGAAAGAASSSFAGSSLFGQKPAFGGFGSSPTQSATPFGSTFQQTQPAFGTNVFGSTPAFGASSTPAFGASSSPAFGASSTPAFGASSTPAFGASSTPAFGASSTPAFGSTSTSLFGNTAGAFGTSSTPAFGTSTSSLFGASTTPAFGASSAPTFGASNMPSFGAASTPSFSFGSTPALGQTTSTFGTSTTAFGSQSSPFGAQATTPTFGSPNFGQQPGFGAPGGGSRLTPYTATPEEGTSGTGQTAKLESISAMPAYKDKSHEELRWEDYQRGDKGGPNPNPIGAFGQTTPGQPATFGATGTFGPTSSPNPFGGSKPSTPSFGSGGIGATPSPIFGSASSSPFSSSTTFGVGSTTPSIFGSTSTATTSPFSSTSIFGGNNAPAFGSSNFGSSVPSGPTFGSPFGGTQSSGLFQSSPSFGTNIPSFGQPSTASGFQQSAPAFAINTSSSGFGLFNSTATPVFSQSTPALSTPFQTAASAPSLGGFSFSNFGQTQSAAPGSTFSQIGQLGVTQGSVPVQSVPVINPFGALPAMPTMSIGRVGSTPSVQYGISSMPVPEKASASITRTSTMLVPRHLSQRRIKLPPRRYSSKNDGPKVPYFADEDEVPSSPKADAFLIPRENPRSLILRPIEQWPTQTSPDIEASSKDGPTDNANGIGPEEELSSLGHIDPLARYANGTGTEKVGTGLAGTRKENSEAAAQNGGTVSKKTVANNGSSARLPKLTQGDYYTTPHISELEKRERTEPGYCRRVKDFVVGREGYGSIMFYGETNVSGLDLDAIIEFGNREVVVYRDESSKPPVGQGLNKPAEVTVLNVKWVNKKTGQQYLEPERVHKYTEMLKAKTAQQGAHFISYDAPQGEWKFKVDHF